MSDHPQTDQYIDQVLNGDPEAFRFVVKAYQELAYSMAFNLLHNKHDANLAIQNAFVQVFKALESFRKDAKFSTWLSRIVINESIKLLRQRSAKVRTIPIEDVHMDAQDNQNKGMEKLAAQDRRLLVQKVIARLKPKERLVLNLFYLEEYTLNEIQEITGFSNSNIKVLLHRGRKSFAQYFS